MELCFGKRPDWNSHYVHKDNRGLLDTPKQNQNQMLKTGQPDQKTNLPKQEPCKKRNPCFSPIYQCFIEKVFTIELILRGSFFVPSDL